MTIAERIDLAITKTKDFETFTNGLLIDTLHWPLEQGIKQVDDIGFAWNQDELRVLDLDAHVLEGRIWQVQPRPVDQQPWGVFVLEFKNPDVFVKGRGFTGLLRKVLRGLVPSRRRLASLPSWQAQNILFICTYNWEHYRFAHFRSGDGMKMARLSTFGWGPGTSNRTACEFNLPELIWPEDISNKEDWIKKWIKAFDKEELTKRFYRTFAEIYEQVTAEIAKSPHMKDRAQEQAQLLLDRLLFLSFLQKKLWLNRESDYLYRRFLKKHRGDPKGYSFYSEELYPLFEALSQKADHPKSIGMVPFLNGGLFNLEWGADQRNALAQLRLGVKNATFDHIFNDLLNRYNFTVMEDTPLNREVAVDPEMLGKVFETVVLVSDTGGDFQAPDLRKATGSYYTPRIVVHFICREVLLKYLSSRLAKNGWENKIKRLLEIDAADGLSKEELSHLRQILAPKEAAELREAVERLKCCDPAVGSGAFAVGLLQELLNLTLLCEACERGKDPRLEKGTNYLFEKKLQIIENSIYGVDIQAKAVDICKLRLWLSLVVDYELGVDPAECTDERFADAIANIPPLPNLAYKIRQGDALLDQIHGVPFRLERVKPSTEMYKLIGALKEEHKNFFKEENPVKKRHIRKTVLDLRIKLTRMQMEAERANLVNLVDVQEGLFGETAKETEKRKWREAEEARIGKALKEIDWLEKQMLPFKSKNRLSPEDEERLSFLESGIGRDLSFSWRLDFPEVFNRDEKANYTVRGTLALTGGSGQQDLIETIVVDDGFDIIVGNPPFVTSRDKVKRELYRQRWAPYCHGQYHLLVPFFPRSFGIMAKEGQLGFIVSNAFAKREFGQPLIEKFFPTVDVNKIVDCSGLMFPGHGTPTCIVFGKNAKPKQDGTIRVAAILPGGGDLRTAPEDSPLWSTIETHHDDAGFADNRVVVSDRSRISMSKWPWNFDIGSEPTKIMLEKVSSKRLKDLLRNNIGYHCVTRADDIYFIPVHLLRKVANPSMCLPQSVGDGVRDWGLEPERVLFPYDSSLSPITMKKGIAPEPYLSKYKELLSNRIAYGRSQVQSGRSWYEYSMLFKERFSVLPSICYSDIATHNHFYVVTKPVVLKDTAPVFALKETESTYTVAGCINSSTILFWLKQVCFSKREAEDAESGTYYEMMTGKVEQIPLADSISTTAEAANVELIYRLKKLSQECSERARLLPSLAMKKLFEKEGEAYDSWYRSMPVYIDPHNLIKPFTDPAFLEELQEKVVFLQEQLRNEMISLQEEMDWLVYEAYGLINQKMECKKAGEDLPEPLGLGQRPFELWSKAGEVFDAACRLIPSEWSDNRRELWKRRIITIRENEHIRRIEQPVYKRRWYQPDSYQQQIKKAFEWWLLEKAEWWLENKKKGGPILLDDWAAELWNDNRIRAAAAVVEGKELSLESFKKMFKPIINSETVPEGIPFAVSWDKVKPDKVSAKVKNIRGKLNVPRERFHLRGKSEYLWAGLIWKS